MQKHAAAEAYSRFLKQAAPEMPQSDIDAFNDPSYASPLERKRQFQGAGSMIGSGAGMLGGALAGAMFPKSKLFKILGGVGGGLAGSALGGLGGWGLGGLLSKLPQGKGQEYADNLSPEELDMILSGSPFTVHHRNDQGTFL
jgi:hypothetical protein